MLSAALKIEDKKSVCEARRRGGKDLGKDDVSIQTCFIEDSSHLSCFFKRNKAQAAARGCFHSFFSRNPKAYYTSPYIHTVTLRGLSASTSYSFRPAGSSRLNGRGKGRNSSPPTFLKFKVRFLMIFGELLLGRVRFVWRD